MSESTSAWARTAVEAILARDNLQRLPPDDIERLIGIYGDLATDLAPLRAPEVATAEPAVIFPAE
jgi:hypothetical protein